MASPKMLALRGEMAGLIQRRIVTPPPAHDGHLRTHTRADFAQLSAERHLRRKREIALTNRERSIPVGGPGRRRAKAVRNKQAVEDAAFKLALMSAQMEAACLNA